MSEHTTEKAYDYSQLWKLAAKAYGEQSEAPFIVGYAGSIKTMGLDKGVGQIVEAVDILRGRGLPVSKAIAGTPASEMERLKQNDPHPEEYYGYIPHDDLHVFYNCCDVLVYPCPETDHPYFLRDTSPLKVFEYMAARRPVIAADTPPIRDVLDESMAYFYSMGDSEDMARVIEYVLMHYEEAIGKAAVAYEEVRTKHTWEARMKSIMDHVSHPLDSHPPSH